MADYLRFVEVPAPERKTRVVQVYAKISGAHLGTIQWFGRWRQYAFWPMPNTIFNTDCMTAISNEIRMMMNERRRRKH